MDTEWLQELLDWVSQAYYLTDKPEAKHTAQVLIALLEDTSKEMQELTLSRWMRAKSANHVRTELFRYLTLQTDLLPHFTSAKAQKVGKPGEGYMIPNLTKAHKEEVSGASDMYKVPNLTLAHKEEVKLPDLAYKAPRLTKHGRVRPIRSNREYIKIRPNFALERTLSGYRENYIEPPKDLSDATYKTVRADLEVPLLEPLVRAKRKHWGGQPRVLLGDEGEEVLYHRRYVHRRINSTIKGIVTEQEQGWSAETLRRMLSHTLLKPVVTGYETVASATTSGLEDSYTEALKVEINRQVSKSPAMIDAWDEFGKDHMLMAMVLPDSALAELGLLQDPKTAPQCTFKETKKAFMRLEDRASDMIADAWADYHEKASLGRLKELFTKQGKKVTPEGYLTADEIDKLGDADLSFLDPDY